MAACSNFLKTISLLTTNSHCLKWRRSVSYCLSPKSKRLSIHLISGLSRMMNALPSITWSRSFKWSTILFCTSCIKPIVSRTKNRWKRFKTEPSPFSHASSWTKRTKSHPTLAKSSTSMSAATSSSPTTNPKSQSWSSSSPSLVSTHLLHNNALMATFSTCTYECLNPSTTTSLPLQKDSL